MERKWLSGAVIGLILLFFVGELHRAPVRPSGGGAEIEVEDMPLVALTFDDGPNRATTTALLDGLSAREIPATFFPVGERIPGNEDILKRMAEEGHQIGIHTWSHVKLTDLDRAEYEKEIGKTRGLIQTILGPGDYRLRPPYGITDEKVRSWADGPLILWSVDPEDWRDRDRERIVSEVLDRVKDGDIVLLHDIYGSSVEAALEIAEELQREGFCFVTVEQLMALRGGAPKPGELVRSFPE